MVLMREHSRTFRVVTEVPAQRPEGALIEHAREVRDPKPSGRAAANLAGMSEGRWRQIVNGYMSAGAGQYIQVVAPPETLARMARAVGVTVDQLTDVGRPDAAAELLKLQRSSPGSHPVGTGTDPLDLTGLNDEQVEAIKQIIRAMRSEQDD